MIIPAALLVIALSGAVYGFAAYGPVSFRAQYRGAVNARLAGEALPQSVVTEQDIAHLPDPVQRYLRVTGALGQPRIQHFRATWRGRIRANPDDPWMPFTAEQVSFIDRPARYFLMDAKRGGLPVGVLHVFENERAAMRVRLLSLYPLTNASGPDLDRAETVTLFNDLCLLAPGALIDPAIQWDPIDASSVRAYYTIGDNTISATLLFNDVGELVDFTSDDRLAASADGSFAPRKFSTPVQEYGSFGERRVMTNGEGWWRSADGDFAYIEMELLDLEVNSRRSPGR